MNNMLIALCLLSITPVYAGSSSTYDNIYVTPNIEEHLPEFVAMEITKDLKETIADYNLHRKDPQYFAAKITDPKILKLFNQSTKKLVLPEITQKNDSYYSMKAGKNTVEFNASLFLERKYFLNGVEKILKTDDLLVSNDSHLIFKTNIFNSLIAEAVADDDDNPDFNLAYKNLDTTKVLMASIIALDSSFKSRSILDKIPMMNDVADVNMKNLVKKVEAYQAKCEENLNTQTNMMRAPNSDWNNLGSMDRFSLMRSLRDTADPSYQETLKLVKKIAAENANSSYKRDKSLEETMNIEKKANNCEAMLSNLVPESKSKSNTLSRYLDGGNSAKVAAANHPCAKITNLKMCLSKFATQAASINDFVRKHGADAKEADVKAYDVPRDYPSENTSR
jgi:hypothetical protein